MADKTDQFGLRDYFALNKRIPQISLQISILNFSPSISFSQCEEDYKIRQIFMKRLSEGYKGTYLDIGCYKDGEISNTKILSLLGWDGIAIDANPDLASHWNNCRPNDIFMNLAIEHSQNSPKSFSSSAQEKKNKLKFYRFSPGEGGNTIDRETAEKRSQRADFKVKDVIEIDCLTLSELAAKIISDHPQFKPDVVNIDIENVDILDDLPEFLKLLSYPEMLLMEWTDVDNAYTLYNFKESREFSVLNSCNYEIISLSGPTIICLDKRHRLNEDYNPNRPRN